MVKLLQSTLLSACCLFLISCGSAQKQPEGVWDNDSWGNSFIKGLWEGCISRTLAASGYQILNGMMNDFYSIELQEAQQKFNW